MKKLKSIKKILISRTDNIGDVILTIPMAKILKDSYPEAEIYFLGKSYTKDIINSSVHIDHFINFSEIESLELNEMVRFFEEKKIDLAIHVFPNKELARVFKKAKIPYRLGTKNRLYHWSTCNLRVKLSRKNSHFHESQLNIKLLKDIIPQSTYSIEELAKNYGLLKTPKLNQHVQSFLKEDRINIVLHPRSLGSAREWGLNNYKTLVKELHQTGRYNILITGTQKESESMKKELLDPCREMITDTTGKLTLGELISLITASKGLVAASTGPLHIASACGVNALGLFIMTRPMHPGRWKPVGLKADYIVYDEKDTSLDSIYKISPKRVFERIEKWV